MKTNRQSIEISQNDCMDENSHKRGTNELTQHKIVEYSSIFRILIIDINAKLINFLTRETNFILNPSSSEIISLRKFDLLMN